MFFRKLKHLEAKSWGFRKRRQDLTEAFTLLLMKPRPAKGSFLFVVM
jgi:hypothetical protein